MSSSGSDDVPRRTLSDASGEALNNSLISFEFFWRGTSLGVFEFPLWGDYNLMNGGATLALAHQLGWDLLKCQRALSSFQGVKRRQEVLGEVGGVLVLEDFAHHPTAVQQTVRSVQEHHAKRGGRIFSLFEPRSATSCRNIFQEAYFHAFQGVQYLWVREAFKKKNLKEEDRFSSQKLCEQLQAKGVDAHYFEDVDKMLPRFCRQLRSGDVVLIMSNGSFDGLPQKLLQLLKQSKS